MTLHHIEALKLTKIERSVSYPLHDLTCSPMTSGVYMDEKLKVRENLVLGTVVLGERNFCHLRFEDSRADLRMVLRSIASDGKTQWTHHITAAELGTDYKTLVSTVK